MEHAPKHPKFVRWALMLGIVIILNIFFSALVALALPAPQYNDYCAPNLVNKNAPTTAAACDAAGGMWNEMSVPPATDTAANQPTGYCDLTYTCSQAFTAAAEQHDLYAFIFMILLAVVALLAGLVSIGSSIVSSGLSYGGVIALIIGSAGYWGSAGHWVRFGIAAIGLLALLYVGWRNFKD